MLISFQNGILPKYRAADIKRRDAMGEKSKKDKNRSKNQKEKKKEQKEKNKQDKQPKKKP